MQTYAFDIETFKNFLSITFVDVESEFDTTTFLVFEDKNDLDKIIKFVDREILLCGYNNLYFDNVILNSILEGYSTTSSIFDLAQSIVLEKDNDEIRKLRFKQVKYKSVDFKRMLGLDIGLKQVAVNLNWPTIQDLPIPYDKEVERNEVKLILDYNKNDVLPLVKLWDELKDDFELRRGISKIYGVDVLGESESAIANRIYEKLYCSEAKENLKSLRTKRTIRKSLLLRDCLRGNIQFRTKDAQEFLDKVKDLDIIEGFKGAPTIGNITVNIAKGGIHSKDKPAIFTSTSDCLIIDADAASFYPHIMLVNKIKPAHLSDAFLKVLSNVTRERMKAKEDKDEVKKRVLKIVINATYGKCGNPDYWFYDLLASNSVTISGQFYLLLLIDMLTSEGFEVISANTDGVTTLVPVAKKDKYYEVCHDWEKQLSFSLEFSTYEKYIRRDVNNYIALDSKGKVKRKGIFTIRKEKEVEMYRQLAKGYDPDIIPQALTNYFIKDIPVSDTLEKSNDIFDFLMSEKVGKNFKTIFRNGKGDEVLQKTNRYYASTEGGIILKKDQDREISIIANTTVQIANDIDRKRPFEDYKVDLNYYHSEVMKVVRAIEPKVQQLSLF